jgi:uncharacterized membrane protein YqjE
MDSNLNLFFLTVTILVIITYIIFIWTHKTTEKVRNFVATYKSLEECISSGGKTPIKTS